MRRFMEDLDDLFEGLGNAPGAASSGAGQAATRAGNGDVVWIPAVEIEERDGQLVIHAEIPGVPREQISVEIDDDRLVLSGERVQEHEEHRGGIYRSERVYGRFYRVIPLPDGVDPEQARATFANGVLEITMPLQQQVETGHRIEVQEGQASGQQGQLSQASQEQQATH
jgi:HSP20 family protein